jgi:hypothetical protein
MSKVTWKAKSKSNTKSPIKWQKGFKILDVPNGVDKPRFPFMHSTQMGGDASIPFNQVLKAKPFMDYDKKERGIRIKDNSYVTKETYPAGFHIFTNKMAAKLYHYHGTVFEVEYRRIIAQGEHSVQTRYPVDCDIALEMRVLGVHTFTKEEQELADKLRG